MVVDVGRGLLSKTKSISYYKHFTDEFSMLHLHSIRIALLIE